MSASRGIDQFADRFPGLVDSVPHDQSNGRFPFRIRSMKRLSLLAASLLLALPASALTLYDGREVATIVHQDQPALRLAAELLARDLKALSGQAPHLSTQLADCGKVCVVIGEHDAPVIRGALRNKHFGLAGAWERYGRAVRRDGGRKMLVLAGSDTRGAIWGVIDLTREMGVSAWEWWADVTPRRVERIDVKDGARISTAPSVKYRGIFLNDEDWGLQPWAAKTYDPELGDIGPRTYARIFELMWRLKANTIWPAMHDVTKPFYLVPGNREVAGAYSIVVGTSHAEPMLRNNVREWAGTDRGDFNFFTNRDAILGYWRERVAQTRGDKAIYSVGIRGVHDSAMEGADTPEQARRGVMRAIDAQRELLSTTLGKPATQVPQALTLYKEVLDLYQGGMEVPQDVTLVWPDDNYGYIRQLSGPRERARKGGGGIYYHVSYWGRPHDHLWLATTHPALIRDQLDRTWQMGDKDIWIVNVGDIKPNEYLTQYFLDIAFNAGARVPAARQHLERWAAQQFGAQHAAEIAAIKSEWYDLAWERKPEFMGFGQTEPTTPNRPNLYFRTGGEEARRRLARYEALTRRAQALEAALPADRRDAFFQLVLYPVRAAALLNARILGPGLGRDGNAAQVALVDDTARYNSQNDGKWRHMMDLAPRRLTVFDPSKPVPLPAQAKGSGKVQSFDATLASSPGWETMPGLGSRGASLRSLLAPRPGTPSNLEYKFSVDGKSPASIDIVAVPVHPLTAQHRLRIGVRVDGEAEHVLDYMTVGRSDEWKNNVLTNAAKRSIRLAAPAAGAHTLAIRAIDPGFVLDRIDVKDEDAPDYYGPPPR
jgi:hypothetical protein